jgi:hypothetical protein
MFEATNAPGDYAKDPAVGSHIERMREYLRRQYAVMNQL